MSETEKHVIVVGAGPGGLTADIVGQYNADGTLALDVDGSAPLALANAALDPRRISGQANFDLGVNGPPALTSLSGRVAFENARLAAEAAVRLQPADATRRHVSAGSALG